MKFELKHWSEYLAPILWKLETPENATDVERVLYRTLQILFFVTLLLVAIGLITLIADMGGAGD